MRRGDGDGDGGGDGGGVGVARGRGEKRWRSGDGGEVWRRGEEQPWRHDDHVAGARWERRYDAQPRAPWRRDEERRDTVGDDGRRRRDATDRWRHDRYDGGPVTDARPPPPPHVDWDTDFKRVYSMDPTVFRPPPPPPPPAATSELRWEGAGGAPPRRRSRSPRPSHDEYEWVSRAGGVAIFAHTPRAAGGAGGSTWDTTAKPASKLPFRTGHGDVDVKGQAPPAPKLPPRR